VPFSLSGYRERVMKRPTLTITAIALKARLLRSAGSLALIGLTLAAFWVRVRNWPMVFTADGVHFLGNDTLYHMRRVFQAVNGGLAIPELDLFLNYPAGLHPNWPPLFDQGIAALALLLGGGHPSGELIEVVGALTPPVLGALTIPLLYHIARRLMSRPAALAAAAAGVLLPYAIQISVLGRPDHHVAAVFGAALLLLTSMQAMEAATIRRAIRNGGLAGAALFLCLGVWMGSLLMIVATAAAFMIALPAAHRDSPRRTRLTVAGATLFATAALLFAPLGLTSHFARSGMPAWDAPSPFHLFLLGGTALALVACNGGLTAVRPGPSRRRLTALGVSLLLLALIAAGAIQVNMVALLSEGSQWMLKQDPLLMRLVESQPLTWQTAQENFTRLILLMPLLLGWTLWEQDGQQRRMTAILLACWSLALAVAALRQERFSDLLSLIAAILIGKAVEGALRGVTRIWRGEVRTTMLQRGRLSTIAAALLLLGGGVYAALPPARWLRGYWYSAPRLSRGPIYELCHWLRDQTPDPGGYDDGRRPAYAVLASWPYGHAITYIGRRPNVANPYVGWKENRAANLLPYRFYVSDDPEAAMAMLRAYGVRYVVVTETLLSGHYADMLQALDLPHDGFFHTRETSAGPIHRPSERMRQSMVHRLYVENGAGLARFRLVYRSTAQTSVGPQKLPLFKIFEFREDTPHDE